MPKAKPLPDQETLKRLLDYDPQSGALTWKARTPDMFRGLLAQKRCNTWNSRYAGKAALASLNSTGRMFGYIFSEPFLAHRVAYKILTGADPVCIDHINGDFCDNRAANLRSVDQSQNCKNRKMGKNNRSGLNGVYPRKGKWAAKIAKLHIGTFDTPEAAADAYEKESRRLGFHPNHGRPPKNHKP